MTGDSSGTTKEFASYFYVTGNRRVLDKGVHSMSESHASALAGPKPRLRVIILRVV